PAHLSLRPGFRQRGKQSDHPVMALHQHLRDSGRPTEVAVYLKYSGWVKIKETDCREVRDQVTKMLLGGIAVSQSGIQSNQPGPAPPGMAALKGKPPLDGLLRRRRELRRLFY